MVATWSNVVERRVCTSPPPGHNPLEIMTEQDYTLHAHDPLLPDSIIFNTADTTEIAKFTKEGFYYKGEFIEDAGDVYRLLKTVLEGICYKQLCKDLVDELEGWIAFGDEEDIVDAHALVDRARAALGI
jgi:hypothetical protein